MPAELKDYMKYNLAVGGSCIVNPSGIIIEGPVFNKECIVHKEIDLAERDLAKAYFDCLGHYSRPDIPSLRIHDEAWTPTGPRKLGSQYLATSSPCLEERRRNMARLDKYVQLAKDLNMINAKIISSSDIYFHIRAISKCR